MRVLNITGDPSFKAGNPRFDLQSGAVEYLEALYYGPGTLWGAPKGNFFEVVSSQDPFWRGLVGLFWAWRFRARFNVQVHADLSAQNFLKRTIARFVLKRADSIRAVSGRVKKQVEALDVEAPITVLPVFIDIERFKKIERKPDAQPTILWMGRFEDEKDPLAALDVFKRVCEKIPNAILIMLGAGLLEGVLREAARGLAVSFPGWQDPIPYLARAHVTLSTSPAESFGVSIVESLAAGVPVVSLDVGVAREAGAMVTHRDRLADTVVDVLNEKPKVALLIPTRSRGEWIAMWRTTL